MNTTSSENYDIIKKIMKYKPGKVPIPYNIFKLIKHHDLLSIADVNTRAKIFLKALYIKGLKSNTVMKYFNHLKPYIFQDTTIAPNSLVFDNNYKRTIQYRGQNTEKIKNVINYVKYEVDDSSEYKWPILISAYSGLRINEVCNIKMSHLNSLKLKDPVIALKLKNNSDWEVLYYDEFEQIINKTISSCSKRYNLYTNELIDSKLFNFSVQALHNKIQYYYLLANKEHPPLGFGLHSFRYYLATLLYNLTDKIEISQAILGHKHQTTTERYIKQDPTNRKRDLELLSTTVDLYRDIAQVSERDNIKYKKRCEHQQY
nr:integrase [Menippe mercenaria nudivirus]